MYANELHSVTMIVKLLFITAFILASTDINSCLSMPYSSGSWYYAQNHCKSQGGKLKAPPLDANGEFWTPFYKRYSKWIRLLGCYNESYIGMTITSKIEKMKIPSAGMCQEICKANGNSRFAVQNDTCRCLNSSIKSGSLEPSACTYRCNDEIDPITFYDCGGPSAYNSFLSDDNRLLTPGERCASVECVEAYQAEHQDDCSNYNKILCQGEEKIFGTSGPWRYALDICRNSTTSYLLGDLPLGNPKEICKVINVTLEGQTWIGSVTQIYISSDQGEEIKNQYYIHECEVCNVHPTRRETCDFSSCEEEHKFSCERIPTTKPTTSSSTRQSGTTKFTTPPTTAKPTTRPSSSTKQSGTTEFTTSSLPITTTNATKNDHASGKSNEQGSNDHSILVGILVTVSILIVIGVVMGILILKRRQTKIPKDVRKEVLENELSETHHNKNNNDSKNPVNNNYFVLEPPKSNYEVPDDSELEPESPYNDGEEGTYDHLRDKNSRRKTADNVYQHAHYLQTDDSSDYDFAGRAQNQELENPYYDHANEHTRNSDYGYNTLDRS